MRRVSHRIIGFDKLFEALLVLVGLLQGYVLWRTDDALHQFAGTGERMSLITEALLPIRTTR